MIAKLKQLGAGALDYATRAFLPAEWLDVAWQRMDSPICGDVAFAFPPDEKRRWNLRVHLGGSGRLSIVTLREGCGGMGTGLLITDRAGADRMLARLRRGMSEAGPMAELVLAAGQQFTREEARAIERVLCAGRRMLAEAREAA